MEWDGGGGGGGGSSGFVHVCDLLEMFLLGCGLDDMISGRLICCQASPVNKTTFFA